MTRFLSPGRSLVFGLLLMALVLTAQQPLNWDAKLSDGINAIKGGHGAEAVQILLPLPEQAKAFPSSDVRRIDSTLALAAAYQSQSQLDQAERLYLDVIQRLETRGDQDSSIAALAFENLGRLRLEQGRWREADEFLAKARDLYAKGRNAGDPRIANVNRLLGETYLGQGRIAEGEVLIERAMAAMHLAPDADSSALAATLGSLATAYTIQGRYREAEALLEESLQLNRGDGETELERADGMVALGHLCLLERDIARATPLLRKAVGIFAAHQDSHLPNALSELGSAALQDGKYAIAREYLGRALEINEKRFAWDRLAIAMIQGTIAEAYFGEKDYGQADTLIKEAIATDRTSVGDKHFTLARLLLVEAAIDATQHRTPAAREHYRQALNIYRKTFSADHPDVVKAEREYALFVKNFRK